MDEETWGIRFAYNAGILGAAFALVSLVYLSGRALGRQLPSSDERTNP